MIDCPNDDLIIEWIDSSGYKQVIKGASGYTLEQQQDLSQATYYVVATRPIIVRNGRFQSWEDEQIPSYGGKYYEGISSWRIRFLQDGNVFYQENNKHTNYPENGAYVHRTTQVSMYLEVIDGLGNFHQTFAGNTNTGYWATRIVQLEEEDRRETCQFKVYKEDEIVLAHSYQDCPEVNVYCASKACPPGTCECQKDNLVCCYNPKTGLVVKSYTV